MAFSPVFEIYNQFKRFFWGIGYFGWQISFCYTLFICSKYNILCGIIFTLLFFLSGYLNHRVFKRVIHSSRPPNKIKFLDASRTQTNFGMPSGHTQQTAFALTFAYLLTKQNLIPSILLLAITILQRYYYRNHTLTQLTVGVIVGIVLSVVLHYSIFYIFQFQEKNTTQDSKRAKIFPSFIN